MRTTSLFVLALLSFAGPRALARARCYPRRPRFRPFASPHNLAAPVCLWRFGTERRRLCSDVGEARRWIAIDKTHLIWAASAAYDNSHKSNDNTLNNENGHERSLESSIYYRFTNTWFVGGGATGASSRPPTTPSRPSILRLEAERTISIKSAP